MTSSDCIRSWKRCDLKHPLTTGKPFTGNHLGLDKCLITFNSGLDKTPQTACRVTDCLCAGLSPYACKWFHAQRMCLCVGVKPVCVSNSGRQQQQQKKIPSVLKWKQDLSTVVKLGQRVSGEFAIYSKALRMAALWGPEPFSPLGRVCCVLYGRFMTVYVWLGI